MNRLIVEQIFELIELERISQDRKWGDQSHRSHAEMLAVLVEEVGEVAKAILENNVTAMNVELIQVAAVVILWLEVHLEDGDPDYGYCRRRLLDTLKESSEISQSREREDVN